jgi:hypothetical protein
MKPFPVLDSQYSRLCNPENMKKILSKHEVECNCMVLMVKSIKVANFWDVMQCNVMDRFL